MASNEKSGNPPLQIDLIVQLIEAITDALTKLITTGTSTVVALGILATLTTITLKASSDTQQQLVPLLTGMLGVIIGRMLTRGETSPPDPPGTPKPSE